MHEVASVPGVPASSSLSSDGPRDLRSSGDAGEPLQVVRRVRLASFGLAALLGVLGLVVGAVLGGLSRPPVSATAQLTLSQDPASGPTSSATADDTDRFVQGEVLVLTGHDLRARVTDQLALPAEPVVTAVQVGLTSVLDVSVQTTRADDARPALARLVALYTTDLQRRFAAGIDKQVGVLDEQLTQISTSLTVAASAPPVQLQPALVTEYTRLLAARNQAEEARAAAPQLVQVTQNVRVQLPRSSSAALRDGALGLLVGLVLGVLVVLVRRRLA